MEKINRRHIVASGLALACFVRPGRARAWVFPVIDLERWWAMYYLLQDVKTLTERVTSALNHVQNAAQNLGGGNLVDDILMGHRRLTADLRAIGYGVDTVTTQFKSVFPDHNTAPDIAPADVETLRTGWDQEIHQSSLAASRAQSALSTIERNTASAQAILERSKATTGANDEGSRLAKLQALTQMLGVINSDLTTLAKTIATTERVNASVAAAEASDEELEAAKVQRMLRDYDKSEPIPEVDPRFLAW